MWTATRLPVIATALFASVLVCGSSGRSASAQPMMPGTQGAEPKPSANVHVEGTSYRAVSDQDPGTLRVCLLNGTTKVRQIRKASLNGTELLSVEPPTSAVVWHSSFPETLEPGHRGLLVIKLARPLGNALARVGIEFDDSERVECVLACREDALRITYVGFGQDMRQICVYVENAGQQPLGISRVMLEDQDLTSETEIPGASIAAGDKECLVLRTAKSLTPGQFIGLKVSTVQGPECWTVVRALNFFPIILESPGSAWPSTVEGLVNSDAHFVLGATFDCPAHGHGSWSEASRKVLDAWSRQPKPEKDAVIAILYPCRRDLYQAWPVFAQAGDVCQTNVTLDDDELIKRSGPVGSIAWLTDFIRKCTQPKPFYVTVSASQEGVWSQRRHPTCEEVRMGAYPALAGGAKGIFYRNAGWTANYPPSPSLLKELGTLNAEINAIRHDLATGDVVSWGKAADAKTRIGTVLCGHGKLIIFLMNTDFKSDPKPVEKPFVFKPQEKTDVEIRLPSWLKPTNLKEISGRETLDAVYTCKDSVVSIPVQRLNVTKLLVLSLELNKGAVKQAK